MKKRIMSGLLALFAAASLLAGMLLPSAAVYADGTMVVTIGADLSEDQRIAILKYFGVYGNTNVQTIYVTNADERAHLGSYIPLEQIGNRTISCALVKPTTSGGIQVKTANLDYITSNMIASNLATCGITNCEAIAAAPFEVSGTGALTGILMAYQAATTTSLNEAKTNVATQELVVTSNLANQVGQQVAQQMVNDVKLQIIEGTTEISNYNGDIYIEGGDNSSSSVIDNSYVDNSTVYIDEAQITEIINNVVNTYTNETSGLTDEDIQELTDLATQLASQSYSKGTTDALAQIQTSLEEQTGIASSAATTDIVNEVFSDDLAADGTGENVPEADPATDAAMEASISDVESILNQTDLSALVDIGGGSIVVSSTSQEQVNEDVAQGGYDLDSQIQQMQNEIAMGGEDSVAKSDDPGMSGTEETPAADESQGDASWESLMGELSEEMKGEAPLDQSEEPSSEDFMGDDFWNELPGDLDALSDIGLSQTDETIITTEDHDLYTTEFLKEENTKASVPVFMALNMDDLLPISGTLTVSDMSGTVLASADLPDESETMAVSGEIPLPADWSEGTGLFFQPETNDGGIFKAAAGTTYLLTLEGEFAQTDDPDETDGAAIISCKIENVPFTAPEGKSYGFRLDDTYLDILTEGNMVTATVTFPEDASLTYVKISSDEESVLSSTDDGTGSCTYGVSGNVTLDLIEQGLGKVEVSYYASEDAALNGESPAETCFVYIPVR